MMKNITETEMKKEDFSGTGWLQLGDVVLTGYEVCQKSTII